MKQTKQQIMQQLYDKLRAVSEIPIIERSDINSKGLYMTLHGKREIFIKQTMPLQEKLKVLLHEYSHYIHLTHYYNEESRAECELIANGSASFICREYGLSITKDVDLSRFSDDADVVTRMTAVIHTVANHILARLNQE